MKVVDAAVHVFVGALGFFDFETIEGFGVDDAFDVFFAINDGEIGKTRFVESVKDEGSEDFGVLYEDNARPRSHEVGDMAVIETHNGGEASAVCSIQNTMRGATDDADKIL